MNGTNLLGLITGVSIGMRGSGWQHCVKTLLSIPNKPKRHHGGTELAQPLSTSLWWSHISEGLWLANTTSVVEKAQHRRQFLMVVRKNKLEERLQVTFLPRYSWECADMFHSIEIQNTLYYFTFLFYKILLLLTYKALHGQFPAYIAELLRPYSCSLFLIF